MPSTFVVCNKKEEIRSNASCLGNTTFELSAEDISPLLHIYYTGRAKSND